MIFKVVVYLQGHIVYLQNPSLQGSVLNINHPYFKIMVNQIYPPELKLNKIKNMVIAMTLNLIFV